MKLDINQKQKVSYCVPDWVRDANIQYASKKVSARLQPNPQRRTEPIAIVGYGPSLGDTWELIKDFQYIMTCSGSHRFLLERNITPHFHVEVDPRPHKVELLGQPNKEVEYLIASTCNPKYFDHLEGFNVRLWHVFDASNEGRRVLPHGEWAVTGGCDVGLRALTIAAFLGFRDLHVFGLDGCARGDSRHAALHPNGKMGFGEVEYEGKTYFTTPAMLEAARQTLHELKQMPAVKAKFYGEGLTQALVKDYVPDMTEPEKAFANIVGYSKPELISAEYRSLNAQLHRDNLAYGVGGAKHAETILKLATAIKSKNILDYGCGKGALGKSIPWHIAEYDPCVPGKEESPKPADLVVCTDVLEHIEPEKLQFVLDDLRRVTKQVGYFVIHSGPAMKTLPDGRNTHLIQKDKTWWKSKLKRFFNVGRAFNTGPELIFVVGPRGKSA